MVLSRRASIIIGLFFILAVIVIFEVVLVQLVPMFRVRSVSVAANGEYGINGTDQVLRGKLQCLIEKIEKEGPTFLETAPNSEIQKNLLELPENEFMRLQDLIQTARKQHLHDMCQRYHKAAPNPIGVAKSSKEMLVIEKHKLVMCVTAKVAGKSWKRVLNVLAGLSNSTKEGESWRAVEKARPIQRLNKYNTTQLEHAFKEYTFVMFSRHPLSRILSAFNNLIAPNATDYRHTKSYQRLGYQIIKQYRPWAPSLKTKNPAEYDLTFHDYVRFLTNSHSRERDNNNHFIENYKFCNPCDIPYTVIGKFETLLEDAKYILKRIKADDIVSFPETEGFDGMATHSSDLTKMISFYDQVPIRDLEKLTKRYEMDFILFNYTLPTRSVLLEWLGFE